MDSTSPQISRPSRRSQNPFQKWYDRQCWRGPHGIRRVVLARDPICMICHRNASTIADHIIPHKGVWELFISLTNLMGVCKPCHDIKTNKEDGGFGNPSKPYDPNAAKPTGDGGKQFQSSSIPSTKLDTALDFNVDDLLKGIPE